MRRVIDFPAAFESVSPRRKQPQTVVGIFSDAFTVREVDEHDAPVAFTVDDPDMIFGSPVGREIRFFEGDFLSDTGIEPEAFPSNEMTGVEHRGSVVAPIAKLIARQYGAQNKTLHPHGALHVLEGLSWSGGVPADYKHVVDGMREAAVMADIDDATFQYWHNAVKARMSDFKIIGGSVWVAAAEPCYTLGHGTLPGLTTRSTVFFPEIRHGKLGVDGWLSARADGPNFSCLDRDRAHDRARRKAAEVGNAVADGSLPVIDVLIGGLPLLDFDAHEFERVSRLLVHDVADGFRSLAHGHGVDFFKQVRGSTMDAFTRARDLVAGMDAREGILPTQEAAVMELWATVSEELDRGERYLARLSRTAVGQSLADWNERQVSINAKYDIRQEPGALR